MSNARIRRKRDKNRDLIMKTVFGDKNTKLPISRRIKAIEFVTQDKVDRITFERS